MIYTSFFSSKKYELSNAISIARKTPDFLENKIEVYEDLCPKWELISDYKKDNDRSKYIIRYCIETLSRLNPDELIKYLDNKVLLCYEKSGDFCHRHIVAKWLSIYTHVETKEL